MLKILQMVLLHKLAPELAEMVGHALAQVMMDRGTYDPVIRQADILEQTLRESANLIERWHGRDDGRPGDRIRLTPTA